MADPGITTSISETLLDIYSQITIDNTSWIPIRDNRINLIYDQLLDGILYCCFTRVSKVIGSAAVNYTLTSIIGSQTPGTQAQGNVHSSLRCDMITVAVNLGTGEIGHATTLLYENQLTVYGWAGQGFYRWRHNGSFYGFKESVAATMPIGHPFKNCGEAAWSFIPSTGMPMSAIYNFGLSQVGSLDFDTSVTSTGEGVLAQMPYPIDFSRTAFATAINIRLGGLRGFDSTERQRLFSYWSGYYEWSDLSDPWFTCDGYALLGERVQESYGEYSPDALVPREELLILDGLGEDQEPMAQDPTAEPATSLPGGTMTGYPTSNSIYFREAPTRPSLAGSDLRYLKYHYLINS